MITIEKNVASILDANEKRVALSIAIDKDGLFCVVADNDEDVCLPSFKTADMARKAIADSWISQDFDLQWNI